MINLFLILKILSVYRMILIQANRFIKIKRSTFDEDILNTLVSKNSVGNTKCYFSYTKVNCEWSTYKNGRCISLIA